MTRLIDADALSKDLEKRWDINDDQDFCNKEVWHALEEAPTIEPDGDLISRQNAVKEIDSFCGEVWTEREADFARGLGTALSIVESLPSAEQVTGKLNNPDDSLLTADSEACKEQKSKLDLISRQDALKPFCVAPDGTRIPEVDCDNFPVEFSVEFIKKHLLSLPSAPDSRQRETNKEIAERIINNTCKNRVFCELYPDACRKEDCDIYLVINTFLNTPDTDTPSRQRGEWVHNDKIGTFKIFTCDKCGCNMDTDAWNFCPNCGAYMGGQYDGQKR